MSTSPDVTDESFMRRALLLAQRGRGHVEPNPMVGCVIVRDDRVISEGWHQRFGEAHAEVNALAKADDVRGATLYVTLEPCCHTGKTPPCTEAIIGSGVSRVVVATLDPNTLVAGRGIKQLKQAGIDVTLGVCRQEADRLIAPFRKLVTLKQPWIIAKWAMSLDGKIATVTGDSQWISGEASRRLVHEIRGCVDGILVGSGTVRSDDPLLTARPQGPRTAARIVVDSGATLPSTSQLVATTNLAPVIVAVGPEAQSTDVKRLQDAGCEVLVCSAVDRNDRLRQLIDLLGERQFTNVLCEGGSELIGSLFDLEMVDEVHAFVAPIVIGGRDSPSAVGGIGRSTMSDVVPLVDVEIETLESDVHVHGDVDKTKSRHRR